MNRLLLTLSLILYISFAKAQSGSCNGALPFCTTDIYTFPAGTNTTAPVGPAYGCLFSQPNPAWYYMKIATSGNIVITMASVPPVDIDFICWGPFTSPTGACLAGLTAAKIVSCSYSTAPVETCNIPAALVGQYYMLLITNYSNLPCNITFTKTAGTGETDCGIVVPISLLGFEAKVAGDKVELSWKTASENNNSYFMVERSSDGKTFEEVGRIEGAGSSNFLNVYSLEDNLPLKGVSYYRLGQTDYNGLIKYSAVITVVFSDTEEIAGLSSYPNPVRNIGELSFMSNSEGKVTVHLNDLTGRVAISREVYKRSGINKVQLDLSDEPAGVYYVTLISDNKVIKHRLVKE